MSRAAFPFRLAAAAASALLARAAERAPATATEPAVQLAPMIVEASTGSAPWLYARINGDEYLSRCSPATTRMFIESRARVQHRLRAIVPDAFLAEMPSITLLADQDVNLRADDRVAREILRADKSSPVAPNRSGSLQFLPNLGLDGRDLSALFAYIDGKKFAETELAITAGYLRFRLERRTPMLPPWLVEGILAVHAQIDVKEEPVTLRSFVWLTAAESRAIARDPLRPRALLPAGEMFAPDALRGEGNRDPRRVQTLQAQVGLFVRWALDPRNQSRDAFWEFARRASEQRVTEALFSQCFGFGFSDLRDRLNDYLPLAIKQPLRLDPGPQVIVAFPEPKAASPREVARLRGEWERLEIPYAQRAHPEFAASYIQQARRTLQRAYDQDDRDPRLLAALGLCEIDAGDPAAGLPFLEAAMAAEVTRPRAYHEAARFRFSELMRGQPATRLFSAAEIAPVVEPLRRAVKLTPQLPEILGLLADAWVRSRETPAAEDVEALVRGAKYFAMNPLVSYRLALALARCGRRAEAIELLATGAEYVTDEAQRARYAQLQMALANAAPATR